MKEPEKSGFERNEEAALDELLAAGLPKPPQVSSNFTARVLEQVRLEEAASRRGAGLFGWLRLPRLAPIAGVASLAAIFGFALLQHERKEQRAQMVETLEAVAEVAKKANPSASEAEAVVTVLTDFDAIRRLPRSEGDIDVTLISALTE